MCVQAMKPTSNQHLKFAILVSARLGRHASPHTYETLIQYIIDIDNISLIYCRQELNRRRVELNFHSVKCTFVELYFITIDPYPMKIERGVFLKGSQ